MDTLRIWNAVSKTDPAHTKRFKRAGGFEGTAVTPIYTDRKMTERFGPCGIGWGMSEPTFQLVNGSDGEVAVYCWLALWYAENGTRSDPVYGVGGDFAIKKNKYGLTADDEAFKKAYTDALGNAMKHLGMSADVHMGQHDDDKYVTQLRREIANEGRQIAAATPPSVHEPENVGELVDSLPDPWAEWLDGFKRDFRACTSDAQRMDQWTREKANLDGYKKADPAGFKALYDWMKATSAKGKAA